MDTGIASARFTPLPNRWIVLSVILIGGVVGGINNNIVNVALPSILDQLGESVGKGVWVITAYSLTSAVFQPLGGRLGDTLGHRRVYLTCLAAYIVLTVPCALADSFGSLVAFRALQGLSAAAFPPVAMSVLTATFAPEERGRAVAFAVTVTGLGQSLGPPVGGFLTETLGWRSVFWAPAAVAALGYLLGMRILPKDVHLPWPRFDWWGALLMIAGVACLMFSITLLGQIGLFSPVTVGLLGSSFSLLLMFVWAERKTASPFFDLSLFRIRPYVAATTISALQTFCLSGTMLLVPLLLISALGQDVTLTGSLLFLLPTTTVVLATLGGRLNDRLGSRPPILAGWCVIAMAAAGLAWLAPGLSMLPAALLLLTMGVGVSLCQTPTSTVVTYMVEPARMGVAIGFFSMLRMLGHAMSAPVFGAMLQVLTEQGVRGGYSPQAALAQAVQTSFVVMTSVAVVSIAMATWVHVPTLDRVAAAPRGISVKGEPEA